MSCVHPYLGVFPCGKCLYCRIQYSAAWSSRLLHELSYWSDSVFLTLTYDDDHNPYEISKRELQLFFKRLRARLDGCKIKYFACGEYGDLSARPHYHAIIFGLAPDYDFSKVWSKGFFYTGSVTYDSIRYCTDYVLKKYDGKKADDVYGDFQVPFRLLSNGLGLRYVQDNKDQLLRAWSFTVRGSRRKLPYYYRVKLLNLVDDDDLRYHYRFEVPFDRQKVFQDAKYKAFYAWLRCRGWSDDDLKSDFDFDYMFYAWQKETIKLQDARLHVDADFRKKGFI